MAAVVPASCPVKGDPGKEGECHLVHQHRRGRKTGPKLALLVIKCRSHGVAFTLYPHGYGPYRRQSVAKVAPDGRPILAPSESVEASFEGTVFEAATDAKQGRRWARDTGAEVPDRWWSTQGRHLRLAARLLGVAQELTDKVRESIAAVLSVGTLQLRELCQAKGYRAIGQSVCTVLSSLKLSSLKEGWAWHAQQLLICGHLVGQWGEPLHWDATRGVLVRSPFSIRGTSSSP
jgi:hypothetical protein